jgi:hypothetical protein
MSLAAVAALGDAQAALSRAMDNGRVAEVEAATAALARALAAVQAVGAWSDTPELKALVRRALRQGEGAGIRTRYLAEHGRQRLARLHALTGRGGAIGYGRDGRHRAA